MTAAVVPYGEATLTAALEANVIYEGLIAAWLAGGAEAAVREAHGRRNGLSEGDLTAIWDSLPREQGTARAA